MHNHEFDDLQGQDEPESLVDLDEIMRSFGIDTWRNLGAVASPQAQSMDVLVEVEGQRYVLRERPEGMIAEDLSHRYAFQRYLQQEGIPIPGWRLTAEGQPVVVSGEDYFELQQWAEGEMFSTSDARSLAWCESAGSMLGRIHRASSRYTGPQHRWPAEAHVGAIVQGYLNLARQVSESNEIQAIVAGLTNWIEQWEAVLPAAMVSIGSGRSLPEFHIHGDYHALNLRFGTPGVTVVKGLEASHWEKRIFEVAYGLFYFSALQWEPEESLARPLVKRGFEPERARHFMRAYSKLCPPSAGEAELLPEALMLIAPVATINGPLEDLFFAQEDSNTAVIDDVMERLAWATSLPAWLRRVGMSLAEMWD